MSAKRISIAINEVLLKRIDAERGRMNRSKFIEDLMWQHMKMKPPEPIIEKEQKITKACDCVKISRTIKIPTNHPIDEELYGVFDSLVSTGLNGAKYPIEVTYLENYTDRFLFSCIIHEQERNIKGAVSSVTNYIMDYLAHFGVCITCYFVFSEDGYFVDGMLFVGGEKGKAECERWGIPFDWEMYDKPIKCKNV